MQCPKCHTLLKDGTKFCGSCGSNIEVNIIRTCPNCSTAIVGNEKFCGHCGRTITNNVGADVNKNLKIENKINVNGFKKMAIMGLVGAIIVCGVAYFFYASNTKEVAKNSQSENIKQNSPEPSKATITDSKKMDKNKIDFAVLQNITREDSNGTYSLYIRDDVAEVEYANSDEDIQKAAGGLAYIPIMVTTLIESYNGRSDLDKLVTIQDIAGGTGKLTKQDIGRRLSIKQLLEIMMQYSDNTTANLLIDQLGGLGTVNNTMKNLNIDGIVMNRKLMDTEAINRGLENYCSPKGIGHLLSLIAENKTMTNKECEYAIRIMVKTDHTGIAKYLPDNISVSHQIGVLSGVCNDAAIINTSKGRIVLVAMGKKVDQDTATDIFGKVAKAVVEQLQK